MFLQLFRGSQQQILFNARVVWGTGELVKEVWLRHFAVVELDFLVVWERIALVNIG